MDHAILARRLTDFRGRPGDPRVLAVYAVHNELPTPPNVVDCIFQDADATSGLDDDVESVWVVRLQLSELRRGILPGKLDVLVTGTNLLCHFHLQASRGSNDDSDAAILAQHLGQDQAGWACTKDQCGRTHLGSDLIQAVGCARSGLEQSCIDV